jgi:hypothetical protein
VENDARRRCGSVALTIRTAAAHYRRTWFYTRTVSGAAWVVCKVNSGASTYSVTVAKGSRGFIQPCIAEPTKRRVKIGPTRQHARVSY